MDEIIKAFRDFVARDLVFLISGGALIGACLYLFKRVPAPGDSWILFALLGGIGYFLAYGIQDVFCILGVLPTIPVHNPGCFVRWMYERYYHRKWAVIDKETDLDEVRHKIPPERQPELERLIMFQQIGTAGGPCIIFSGLLFFAAWLCNHNQFDFSVAIGGWTLGLVLICLSWLKAAQRAQFFATNIKD